MCFISDHVEQISAVKPKEHFEFIFYSFVTQITLGLHMCVHLRERGWGELQRDAVTCFKQ